MVKAHRVDAVEACHVVLVGRIVAVPGNHVKRRVIDLRAPQPAQDLGDHFERAFAILVGGDRRKKVPRIGQPVGTDGAQVRQTKALAVVLADVAAGLPVGQLGAELDAARNHRQLAWRSLQNAQFGTQQEPALLRQDQHFAVSVIKETVLHGSVGHVEMNAHAILHGRVAVAAQRDDAFHKIRLLRGQRQRVPAHLVGRRGHLCEWPAAHQRDLAKLAIRLMHHRGPDAVTPCAAIQQARSRKGCTAELFRVEPQRGMLRGILALRQRAGVGLGGKLVAKTGLVSGWILLLSHGEAPIVLRRREVSHPRATTDNPIRQAQAHNRFTLLRNQ